MERCNFWKQDFRWLAVSTCPPGHVLAGPDMTKSRLSVQFYMFWIRNMRNWTKSRDLVMSGLDKTFPLDTSCAHPDPPLRSCPR